MVVSGLIDAHLFGLIGAFSSIFQKSCLIGVRRAPKLGGDWPCVISGEWPYRRRWRTLPPLFDHFLAFQTKFRVIGLLAEI